MYNPGESQLPKCMDAHLEGPVRRSSLATYGVVKLPDAVRERSFGERTKRAFPPGYPLEPVSPG